MSDDRAAARRWQTGTGLVVAALPDAGATRIVVREARRAHATIPILARDERALAGQIWAIDLGMLILAALGAYVLAGRTLRPIQEAMERQERFAVAASHELRTPLTVLQGTLEVALLRERP